MKRTDSNTSTAGPPSPRDSTSGAGEPIPACPPPTTSSALPPHELLHGVSAVLTHHWLLRERGGEKVLRALCEILPGAPLFTLVHDRRGAGTGWPAVRASPLQWLPGATKFHSRLLPLMPLAAQCVRLPPVDLVVCSDAALAKLFRPAACSCVVCYCHSPPRWAWEPRLVEQYRAQLPGLGRGLLEGLLRWVRRCDHAAAQRVDRFVANSQHVARRIARHYGRDACVIYPPVDLPEAPSREPREDFLLCAGQHVPYKRLDLAVAACARLRRRLVVIGEGPDVRRLRGTCGDNVQWLGWQPRTAIETHYRRAQALLFPGEEDFGIVPVEAMAHGCPVVAYDCGGAAESVVDGETGVLFSEQTVDGLIAGIERLERSRFEAETMHARMRRFNRARFLEEMRVVLTAALAERSSADGSPGLKPARVRDP